MPKIKTLSQSDRDLGTLLAERAGLDPSKVLEEWDVQSFDDEVMFTFQVVSKMPRTEWEALVATHEAKQG
jgi:hypothetical protein